MKPAFITLEIIINGKYALDRRLYEKDEHSVVAPWNTDIHLSVVSHRIGLRIKT